MRIDSPFRILVALLAVGVLAFLSCSHTISEPISAESAPAASQESVESDGPPPLVVDTSAPLLLDEPADGQGGGVKTEAAAENTACFVCHVNYMTESLAGTHAGANIGCANCHGPSIAHRNDENNTTPPQIMYAAEKIDIFCRACHTVHDIPPRTVIAHWLDLIKTQPDRTCAGCHEKNDVAPGKVVARWKEKGLDKTQPDPDKLVCTDCHGDHRMRIRTVIWDKKTGELLRTNRGQ
ncbi:MAG: cytochrome c3 family protein [Sedimentisphaerales bacterium]|jgi:hypothetical protein